MQSASIRNIEMVRVSSADFILSISLGNGITERHAKSKKEQEDDASEITHNPEGFPMTCGHQ